MTDQTTVSGSDAGRQARFGSPHFSRGGDGVTNFAPEQFPIYQKAIVRYADKDDALYIGPPMPGGFRTDYALRCRVSGDLSEFWSVLDVVKAEHEDSIAVLRKSHAALFAALTRIMADKDCVREMDPDDSEAARSALAEAQKSGATT